MPTQALQPDNNSNPPVTQGTDRNPLSSSSPYKRAYKACESCRKTKAKCELEPSATACSKCVREQRDCVFPPHRSMKRARVAEPMEDDGDGEQRVTPIRSTTQPRPSTASSQLHAGGNDLQTDATTATTTTRQTWPIQQRTLSYSQQNEDMPTNLPGRSLPQPTLSDPISSSNEPEFQPSLLTPDPQPGPAADLQSDVMQTFVTSSKDAMGLLFRAAEQIDSEDSDEQQPDAEMGNDGSAAAGSIYNIQSPSMPSPGLASTETLDLWDQHRFVRQGWFTAREAVAYLEFFFRNLSPLSPVADSYYADHKNHKRLILEEPLLCCTLLMIASRHHIPTNSSLTSRADFIHMRLWKHVEHLIMKITFGAEKYSIGKTRTLGSIQALLLIIEWHPRALHFPPETDGWDSSLAPSIDDSFQTQGRKTDAGRRWREDVFEPAKRSDRMSWMLIGQATTLAHELGVFDHSEDDDGNGNGNHETLDTRRTVLRTRRLLYLYCSQLSLRLGCTSVFPTVNPHLITYTPDPNSPSQEQANIDREIMISKWIEITKLLTTATEMFFASPSASRQMLRSSRYVGLLDHFQPLLARWYDDFTNLSCPTVADPARQILLVDYYYVRMYINSIAIQALVERARSYNSGDIWLDTNFLRSEFAPDSRFVQDVRDSSTAILAIATRLADAGILMYCPVRLFLRIVSASIFLLKSISLGSREADVMRSLGQLEACIEALRSSRADDIHLSSRYAMLIARHVRRFRRNFRIRKSGVGVARGGEQAGGVLAVDTIQNVSSSQTASFQPQIPSQTQNLSGVSVDPGEQQAQDDSSKFVTPFFGFDDGGAMQDWLAQPFNLQVAPFGTDWLQPASGLAVDSLDFLWNMST